MSTSFKLNDTEYVLTFNDGFNDESLRLYDGGWTTEIDIAEMLGGSPDTLHTNVWN